MNYKQRLVCSELSQILEQTDSEYVSRIPKRVLDTIEFFKDNSLKQKLDINDNLNEENFDDDTLNVLAWINYKFWSDSEEEKNELKTILNQNFKIEEEKRSKRLNSNKQEVNQTIDLDNYIEEILENYQKEHQMNDLPMKKETIIEKIKELFFKNN